MRRLLLLLAFVLTATACGSDTQTPAPATAPAVTTATEAPSTTQPPDTTAPPPTATTVVQAAKGFPVTVAGAEISDRPTAIVSLSPTATEVLFAIEAGDQVTAVDMLSNFPANAPISDLDAFNPSVEAIAALEPDLVVISWDPGELVAGLNALGIPVINHGGASSFDDAYRQIIELGEATGNSGPATELIVTMQAEIAALVDEYQAPTEPLTFYHEVDNTLYSATSSTFAGSIYSLFGLENIADAADPDGFGFPQLAAEYIIEADPDIVFYGCVVLCGTSPATIAERPGWSGMTALDSGALVALDDDVASRWGPRLVEFVRLIRHSLETLSG